MLEADYPVGLASHFPETVPMSNYFQCKTLFRMCPMTKPIFPPLTGNCLDFFFTSPCNVIPNKGKLEKENKISGCTLCLALC